MGRARHLLSLLALTVGLGLAASGCGSSADEGSTGVMSEGGAGASAPAGSAVRTCRVAIAGIPTARASGVGCARARGVVSAWSGARRCAEPRGGSRVACSAGGLRCLGTATDRGLAVSCAGPGRSVAFLAKRG
ncbi:MAG TPA: hypothetical protein VG898_07590 [Solirubrobacterales bacterium]|nr:hypothetical protein [Solirubrobacterales bacterium]